MKKNLLIVSVLVLWTFFIQAKTSESKMAKTDLQFLAFSDSIVRLKSKGGYYNSAKDQYRYHDKIIGNDDLKKLLKSNEPAFKTFRKYKTSRLVSYIFALAGGAFIASPLENIFEGKKIDWTPALYGAGMVVLAFPIALSSDHQIERALNQYNHEITGTSINRKDLKIAVTRNGIGLYLRF